MANKKFYITLDGVRKELKVEISPILAQTLDETIDNMTIDVAMNKRKEPYPALRTSVELVQVYDDDSTETINKFIVSADNVQLAAQNPLRYKHTLTLVQRAQVLTKKEIRNTVFSTSLETSQFAITVASTKILHHYELYYDKKWAKIKSNSVYESEQQATPYVIDLSKKRINKIYFTKFINAQVPQYSYLTVISKGGDNSYLWGVNQVCNYEEHQNISDYFLNQNQADRPSAHLSFKVDGVEIATQSLSDDNFNTNKIFHVDESIIEDIATYQSGSLTVEIVFNPTTNGLNSDNLNENKIPMIITIGVELNINSTEMSCYEVIETLLKQRMKETKAYNSTNDSAHFVPLFLMPTSEHNSDLYELLTTTSAPNFVFTQGNMYEALVEIFKLFDAIFTIDNDGYLDIEYYNVHEPITFDEDKKAGRQSSLGEERFANRLLSYYQNTKINDKFPNSNKVDALAYIRSKSIGVPAESDYVFVVPKPIDVLHSVKTKINFSVGWVRKYTDDEYLYESTYNDYLLRPKFSTGEKLVDLTKYVQETSIWSVLSESKVLPINGDFNNVGKYNCLDYTRGSNFINISRYYEDLTDIRQTVFNNVLLSALYVALGIGSSSSYFSIDITDFKDIKLAVSYIALADGKIVNESIDYKYDGGMLINQNNGSIDINKLGLNMVGLSLKLGQPTLTMTQKICKWEDRVRKGQFFMDGDDKWVANTCNYTLINKDYIESTIEFVKNFNGLASRIELNREKRLSNISNELTTKCEENYGEYIYYSYKNIGDNAYGENVAFGNEFLRNMLLMTFGRTEGKVNINLNYDASSKIVDTTVPYFDVSDYKQTKMVRVTGYVGNDIQTDNPSGSITLFQNFIAGEGDGDSIEIPKASTIKAALFLDEISGNFIFDDTIFETYDMTTVAPFSYITKGDRITVGIICNGTDVIGAVVLNDYDYSGSATWFNPSAMILALDDNTYKLEYVSLTALDEYNEIINESDYDTSNVAVPLLVYGSGNSVCFEMSFDSPIAAGTQLVYNYVSVFGSTTKGTFSKYVLYTAKDGTATKFTLDFIMLQEELTHQYPKLVKNDGTTPLATYSFGKLEEFAYYKKPNEIFALNYQLHFMPFHSLNECFLSNEFIKNNAFANGLNRKELHLIYTTTADEDDFEYSILDTKGYGTHTTAITGISKDNYNGQRGITLIFNSALTTEQIHAIKTWAVVDEDNNIYFASNKVNENDLLSIYFVFRHHRKEE